MLDTVIFSSNQLDLAASLLNEGKLVAFPTETVYGLGACIFHPQAIRNIFLVKGRPSDNPLIAHVSTFSQIERITVDLPKEFFKLAEYFFPGPLTLIVKRHPCVPLEISAGLPSIALRMPSHPLANQLIKLVDHPLVAPSANLSGKPSATRVEHVIEDFSGKIEGIIDGGSTEFGIESTVVSLLENKVMLLRPGAIKKEAIEDVLKFSIQMGNSQSSHAILSPGMKYRHYSPKAFVRIFLEKKALLEFAEQSGCNAMILSNLPLSTRFEECRRLNAKDLYFHLREADRLKYKEVWILCDPHIQGDLAIMNRICRAAGDDDMIVKFGF